MWARRCEHEASLHESSVFLTLTYSDDHLPPGGNLEPDAVTRFLKRLRKLERFRYFLCGEYGERTGRPHYHALLFGLRPERAKRVGKDLYTSDLFSRTWKYGEHKFGAASPAAANYIAKYNLKQVGDGGFDSDGVERVAPFLRMSRRPAIGAEWLSRYREDLKHGYLVAGGKPCAIPRAYIRRLEREAPELVDQIRGASAAFQLRAPVADPERLRDGEIIHHRLRALSDDRGL